MSHSLFADHPIRKAAVLLSVLDTNTADALLEQMPADQAAAVRHELLSLDQVTEEQQQAVAAEFFRDGGFAAGNFESAVELDPGLARQFEYGSPDEAIHADFLPWQAANRFHSGSALTREAEERSPRSRTAPFRILDQTSDEDVAAFLETEHPQAAALVVSHLDPGRAAQVLSLVAANRQTEIVRRLVELEQTDAEVLQLVEHGLEERLLELAHERRRREVSLAAVASMLTSAKGKAGRNMLENVASHAPQLLQKLPPPPTPATYADVLRLDSIELSQLLQAADPEVLVLALAGSSPHDADRMLRLFPTAESRLLRHATQRLGPTRLSDVEHAQQELAELAFRMEADGLLEMPGRQHFAAVA